ncbi:transposase [Mesorhizobium sp. LSHC422A00]|nr:transposase [Mesorhizobium sp. LSHC426A00]ESX45200.1 transposase [Mesorhizobium sp. LSHC424B00]ESX48694.1 transposase [Mesorhizobium sp. LSHC422A00]
MCGAEARLMHTRIEISQALTRITQGRPVSETEALMPWSFKPDAMG